MLRFTKDVIAKVLELNEGAKLHTMYDGKNGGSENWYLIKGGKLLWRRFLDMDWEELDYKTVQSFLRRHKNNFIMPDE